MAEEKDAGQSPAPAGVPSESGGGMYVAGAIVLLLAIGGLIYSRSGGDEPAPEPVASATPSAAPSPSGGGLNFAPPPPPEEEDEEEPEAEASASAQADGDDPPKKAGSGAVGAGPCAKCGEGEASGALTTAVSQTAGLARGCYNRTLRNGGSEGTITVGVSVGATGGLCSARIVSDSTNNPGLSSCVLSKFQSRTYPKPNRGCVMINVPISFSVKR